MLVEWTRKWIGGIRFALTVAVLSFAGTVITLDLLFMEVPNHIYVFMLGVLGYVAVFNYVETKRKT